MLIQMPRDSWLSGFSVELNDVGFWVPSGECLIESVFSHSEVFLRRTVAA